MELRRTTLCEIMLNCWKSVWVIVPFQISFHIPFVLVVDETDFDGEMSEWEESDYSGKNDTFCYSQLVDDILAVSLSKDNVTFAEIKILLEKVCLLLGFL